MDFVNRAYGQIVELLRSMTPAARITTGLLLAVLVVSLAFMFRYRPESADAYLFGGQDFSQAEIAAMEAAFSKKGLNGWEVVGNRVRVPRSQRANYLGALGEAKAFPETPSSAWDKMFGNDNPLKPKQVRDLEARRAHERTLASMMEEMAGIDVARVQIQEINKGEFPRREERRALVSVKAKGNASLTPTQVETIRNMVASGGGVESQNVTVTDLNTGQAYPGSGESGSLANNLYAKSQRETEDYYRTKIFDRLSTYGEVKVAVHVELNPEMINQTVSDKYDPKPIPIELTDYSKEVSSTRPETGGRPGVVPNTGIGNVSQQISSVAAAESTTTERRENQKSLAGTTRTVTEKAGFVPTWMGVSIGIPRSYFERVWRQRNAAAPGTDPPVPDAAALKTIELEIVKGIEAAVQPLLPKVALGDDPYPRVSVVPYTETPLPAPAGPTLAETAAGWLAANWQTLGLLLLAGSSVLVLRSMIRAAQSASLDKGPILPTETLAEVADEPEERQEEPLDVANSLRARFHASERSLRDELTELVREDPETAADVLQNWIREAA